MARDVIEPPTPATGACRLVDLAVDVGVASSREIPLQLGEFHAVRAFSAINLN
ncbi:MAG TPA: hypothetical protein VIV66_16665 [Pyrinomonadaceae bacterium]